MYATVGKKLENVKLLLDCGAEVEKKNKRGNTFRALLGKYGKKRKWKNPLTLNQVMGEVQPT